MQLNLETQNNLSKENMISSNKSNNCIMIGKHKFILDFLIPDGFEAF